MVPAFARAVMTVSTEVPRFMAHSTPALTPNNVPMIQPSSPISSVMGRALSMASRTGVPYEMDLPRSPLKTPPIQDTYCTT
jgi:hypothetical protein